MRSVPLRFSNRSWYGRERARNNTAILTEQSTVQKPTAKSLPQAARGFFLVSPSQNSPKPTAKSTRSSHGVARKTMKRRIFMLARCFSTQDTTILRHHHTPLTTTEAFSPIPPWILTPDTSVSRARSLVFRCLRLKRIYHITWTPRAFQQLEPRFPRSLQYITLGATSNRI